jgi:hypothetical protein
MPEGNNAQREGLASRQSLRNLFVELRHNQKAFLVTLLTPPRER